MLNEETMNWLIKVCDLGWIDMDEYHRRESMVIEIMKMLNRMIGKEMKGMF